jgi:hypothetical protein
MPIGLDVDFFSLGQQVESGELQGVTSLQDTITQVQTSLDLDQDAVEAATQAANLNGGAYGGGSWGSRSTFQQASMQSVEGGRAFAASYVPPATTSTLRAAQIQTNGKTTNWGQVFTSRGGAFLVGMALIAMSGYRG